MADLPLACLSVATARRFDALFLIKGGDRENRKSRLASLAGSLPRTSTLHSTSSWPRSLTALHEYLPLSNRHGLRMFRVSTPCLFCIRYLGSSPITMLFFIQIIFGYEGEEEEGGGGVQIEREKLKLGQRLTNLRQFGGTEMSIMWVQRSSCSTSYSRF